jgi:hypothetical protein
VEIHSGRKADLAARRREAELAREAESTRQHNELAQRLAESKREEEAARQREAAREREAEQVRQREAEVARQREAELARQEAELARQREAERVVAHVERLFEEMEAMNDDIKDVYAEAKSLGLLEELERLGMVKEFEDDLLERIDQASLQ